MMNDPSKAGHETDPDEMELLLTRLKESIGIFENGSAAKEKNDEEGGVIKEESRISQTVEETGEIHLLDAVIAEEEEEEPLEAEESTAEECAEELTEETAEKSSELPPVLEVTETVEDGEPPFDIEEQPTSEDSPKVTDVAEGTAETEEAESTEKAPITEKAVSPSAAESTQNIADADNTVVFVSADVRDASSDGKENTLTFALDELIGLSRTDIPIVTPRLRVKREKKSYRAMIRRPAVKVEPTAVEVPISTEAEQKAKVDASPTLDFAKTEVRRFSVKHARKTEPIRSCEKKINDEGRANVTEQTISGASASAVDYSAYRMSEASGEKVKNAPINEFTSENQVERIREQYHRALNRSTLRLVLVSILFAVLLAVECLPLFGIAVTDIPLVSSYPILLPLLSLQLLLLTILLAYPEIKEGLRALLEKKPLPETYYVGAQIMIVIYVIACCIEYGTLISIYAMPPTLCALGAALSLSVILMDHIALIGEMRSFDVLSSPGDKLAAEMTRLSAHPEEMRAFPRLSSPRSVRTLHIKKVQFVDGYYRQMNRRVEDFRQNGILFTAVLAASVLLMFVTAFLSKAATVSTSLMAGSALAVLATPISFFLAHRYPVFRAASLAADEQRVFVGESAIQAYSLAKVIAFEDVEAFTSVNTNIRRIKLPSGVEVHQVLYYLTKAFGVIGGPLYGLFSTSSDRIDDYSDTHLLSAEKDGLLVQVGSKRVHIGKSAYLARNGITPYYDGEDERYIAEGKISLMYVAVDGAFMAKFYISYEPSENFCRNARKLAERGTRVILRTFDPNLDDRILQNNPKLSVLPVKIVHKTEKQLNDYAKPRVYSGFVTSGSTRDILRLLLLCDSTKSVIGFGRILRYIASGCGAALITALALMGGLSYLLAPFSVLYYALWFLPLAIEAKRKL